MKNMLVVVLLVLGVLVFGCFDLYNKLGKAKLQIHSEQIMHQQQIHSEGVKYQEQIHSKEIKYQEQITSQQAKHDSQMLNEQASSALLKEEMTKVKSQLSKYDQFASLSNLPVSIPTYAKTVRDREVLVDFVLECATKWRLAHAGQLNPARPDVNGKVNEEQEVTIKQSFPSRTGVLLGARSNTAFVLFALAAQEITLRLTLLQPEHVKVCPSNVRVADDPNWWEWSSYVDPVMTTKSATTARIRDPMTGEWMQLKDGVVVHAWRLATPSEKGVDEETQFLVVGFPRIGRDLRELPFLSEERLLEERDKNDMLYPTSGPAGIIGFDATEKALNQKNQANGVVREAIDVLGNCKVIFSPYEASDGKPVIHSFSFQIDLNRSLCVPAWEIWRQLRGGSGIFTAAPMVQIQRRPLPTEGDVAKHRDYPLPLNPKEVPEKESDLAIRFGNFVKPQPFVP